MKDVTAYTKSAEILCFVAAMLVIVPPATDDPEEFDPISYEMALVGAVLIGLRGLLEDGPFPSRAATALVEGAAYCAAGYMVRYVAYYGLAVVRPSASVLINSTIG